MKIVLTNNIFEFDDTLYQQAVGTAMGTPCAVSYANIFMHFIDAKLKDLAKQINFNVDPIFCYKRYIDDIFIIWSGSVDCLELFLSSVNKVHQTIKFTSTYTCPFPCILEENLVHDCFCKFSCSIPFLDTRVSIKDNKLVTDLYRKPTDRCQYLLPQSCHPSNTTKNIPFSLAYRLVRICSEKTALMKRLDELKDLLLSRNYNEKIVQNALERAKLVSREEALKRVEKKQSDRVVFALDYHLALPDVKRFLHRGWVKMTQDPNLRKAFPKPPMVAFRKPRSLRDVLIRAKVPPKPSRKSVRKVNSMKKCNSNSCPIDPYVMTTSTVKSTQDKFSVLVNKPVDCLSSNVVYLIQCTKCSMQYIGQTGRPFKERIKEHLSYVRNNKISEPTGFHFNLPGHDISMLRATVLAQCKFNSRIFRETREEFFINKFQTKFSGMNRKL